MRYVKWVLIALPVLIVLGFLHYTLPRHDVVRIVESEVRRIELGNNTLFWGSAEPSAANAGNRDVKFISGIKPNGRTIVYRNEDTGWGWPPYFKINSADVQARAADLTSTAAAPQWVIVKRYGWRNQFFSIYPNVLSLKATDSPDPRIIPWFNIALLTGLAVLVLWIWRMLARFKRNRVDPVVADVADAFDHAEDGVSEARVKARGRWQRMREWWVETFQ
ncbi:DUF1523 family protein [Qingshengfaniella alkalisoli]|uniref:DUF1523 family protein n=1 Tax=Qingshengfaniella alkalisoli TaxID=2599296 RepID=A0A5B8I7V2_9RHOB|nr:DUF1523 family protein [Qingshengfaniella alkalisoli]QDY69709.1 DUF1523 family protein [Qingshengfaniella alkalisoli]